MRRGVALLLLTTAALLPREAEAQLSHRWQVIGRLSADGYSTSYSAGEQAWSQSLIQEGATLRASGGLMGGELMRLRLGLHAFAVQRFSRTGQAPGSRFGFNGAFTLFPRKPLSLTLTVVTDETNLGHDVLPDEHYGSRSVALSAKYVKPRLPNIYLMARQTDLTRVRGDDLPPGIVGAYVGQTYEGVIRDGRAVLQERSEDSEVDVRYEIQQRDELRDDGDRIYGWDTLRQMVTLRSRARLSDETDVLLWGTGGVYEYTQRDVVTRSQNFNVNGIARWERDRLFATASYLFAGNSDLASMRHAGNLSGRYRLRDDLQLTGAAVVQTTDYGVGGLHGVSSELLQAGALWNRRFGGLAAQVNGSASVGLTQVDPGEDGLTMGQSLSATGTFAPARGQTATVGARVANRWDASALGGRTHLASLDGRWTARLLPRLTVYGLGNLIWTARRDARWTGLTDDTTSMRAELKAQSLLTRRVVLTGGTGYLGVLGAFDRHSVFLRGGVRARLSEAFSWQGAAFWRIGTLSTAGGGSWRFNTSLVAHWRAVDLSLRAQWMRGVDVGLERDHLQAWFTLSREIPLVY